MMTANRLAAHLKPEDVFGYRGAKFVVTALPQETDYGYTVYVQSVHGEREIFSFAKSQTVRVLTEVKR